ncbi:hypothetical protein V6N12_068497 [Hibiscus sabdariffa]|uniref:Uncharacterized protein n=1 Tax=Hibiscus sabdariffa TaxID=183260 RepID=A0ABR2FQ47_9ROSI
MARLRVHEKDRDVKDNGKVVSGVLTIDDKKRDKKLVPVKGTSPVASLLKVDNGKSGVAAIVPSYAVNLQQKAIVVTPNLQLLGVTVGVY